ncbi:D-alanyl-D-alanine carboxypeptidase [Candidatus Saccharibacteria bacterium]|nr:D-alanyl-D-alanine carboxypeptidase [Candidatus Saccharibacteria bacterium]
MRVAVIVIFSLSIILSGAGFWLYQRPLPAVAADVKIPSPPISKAIKLPWPAYGQAAIGAVGFGVLDKNNTSKPVPIASIAKAVTALAILQQKNLSVGQQGPNITFTSSDEQLYRDYLARDGSVLPVSAGQQISQYQALQAMMLPSANNIADTAAIWAFGSLNAYVTFANQFVRNLGMTRTNISDASGFSPKTTSTAEDLVYLGVAALKNPVLAEIVSQKEANFPDVGIVKNVNSLLGEDGILGIKTGNTDEAGGSFLFAAKRSVAGQDIAVIGAILGAPARAQALSDSRVLILSSDKGFEKRVFLQPGTVVGRYLAPWGESVPAVSSSEVSGLAWKGSRVQPKVSLQPIGPGLKENSMVGTITVPLGESKISQKAVLAQKLAGPSWYWRVFHR